MPQASQSGGRVTAHEDILSRIESGITEAELVFLLDEMSEQVERKTRLQVAEDFKVFGRQQETLSWGEAHGIAVEGLCRCRGGSQSCDAEGIRKAVEGGAR